MAFSLLPPPDVLCAHCRRGAEWRLAAFLLSRMAHTRFVSRSSSMQLAACFCHIVHLVPTPVRFACIGSYFVRLFCLRTSIDSPGGGLHWRLLCVASSGRFGGSDLNSASVSSCVWSQENCCAVFSRMLLISYQYIINTWKQLNFMFPFI